MADLEDRSYYHGRITREEAVDRLTSDGDDGSFLLRMSTTQDGVYTISVMQGRAVRHIRVVNVQDGYALSVGDPPADTVWRLIHQQRNKALTNTLNQRDAVRLRYPLVAPGEAIAPDLLLNAGEAGMNPEEFDDMAASFLEGGIDVKELARRRSMRHPAGKPVEDLVRERMGDDANDADLERFMQGKITAEELQRRRELKQMQNEVQNLMIGESEEFDGISPEDLAEMERDFG